MKISIKTKMAKKQINYSDLSKKELELLKEIYIDQKVQSMNNNELRDFAIENISLQIKNTIGDDEESEAWEEMERFFKDKFEETIRALQIKMRGKSDVQDNTKNEYIRIDTEDKGNTKKIDMWED